MPDFKLPVPQYDQKIASQLSIRAGQASAAINLIDEGNTIPFIARYRKELTDSLDEEQLRQLHDLLDSLRKVDERRVTIIKSIHEQGQLTPDLNQQILTVETITELEDIYQPYKPKRKTRASVAREQGLEPLATLILEQEKISGSLDSIAKPYLNDVIKTTDQAWQGARDIVAEVISDAPAIRGVVREKALQYGVLESEKVKNADDEKGVYLNYYLFDSRIGRLKPYQILAINRGEKEKILKVKVTLEERDWLNPIYDVYYPNRRSAFAEQLEMAIQDAAKRLLLPAIERDVRSHLTEQAETHAIDVFANNLKGLLNQPPLAGHVVLGVDPAYRTGCKLAVLDATGKVLDIGTIYPHAPQQDWRKALDTLHRIIKKHHVTLIAIGNGTASRETEQLIAELTRELDNVHYLIVNEAGASVYSASSLARQELPDLDVSIRGAVSIARRVQDPLAELVKIDPKSIGVGMYQHDVNQKQLSSALDNVVESVVNKVGVDLNTASVALLTYVAGIGQKLAENIVAFRDENGKFIDRAMLKKVPKLGAKSFEQAAGFLRVRDGKNPLDASAIHPESYKIAKAVLQQANLKTTTPLSERQTPIKNLRSRIQFSAFADELGTGVPTLEDIFEQLIQPGRDPREDAPPPILRSDVLTMEDLMPGMALSGTVRNVVDFGTFIDIGVKQDGLLHVSKIPQGVVLGVGDIVEIEILSVELDRGRIGLGWNHDQ